MKLRLLLSFLIGFSFALSANAQSSISEKRSEKKTVDRYEKLQRMFPRSLQAFKAVNDETVLERFTYQYLDHNDGWVDQQRTLYSYTNGNRTETLNQYHIGEFVWQNDYRDLYTFNNGYLEELKFQHWNEDAGDWINDERELFTYKTSNGKLFIDEVRLQYWDSGTWNDGWKIVTDIQNGEFIGGIQQVWTGDGWENSFRFITEPDNSNLILTEQYWDNDEWINDFRMIHYSTNRHDLYETITKYDTIIHNGSWYYFLLQMDEPDMLEQYWDGDNWVNDFRITKTTTGSASAATIIQILEEGYEDGTWEEWSLFEYYFDGSEALDSVKVFYPDHEGVMAPYHMEEFLYNEEGLIAYINDIVFDHYTDGFMLVGRYFLDWSSAVTVEPIRELPADYQLGNAYPNPFNPSAIIPFRMASNSHVTIRVYDMLGRQVATLVNEVKPAGEHTVRFNASGLSSGVYLVRFEAAGTQQIRNITLLK